MDKTPAEVRALIREGVIDFPTAGMCRGYAQANLVILPPEYAADFEEFTRRNPFACPVLEIVRGTPGPMIWEREPISLQISPGTGSMKTESSQKSLQTRLHTGKEGYTGFLIGCSFSFEEALMEAGIQVRHIAQGRNVPMYKTNIETVKAGPFEGPMVCSMRPMTPENARKAYAITEKMPNVHGAPVHMGDGAEIGIRDIMKPDYGDAVDLYEGEIPVFWPLRRDPSGSSGACKAAGGHYPCARTYVYHGY